MSRRRELDVLVAKAKGWTSIRYSSNGTGEGDYFGQDPEYVKKFASWHVRTGCPDFAIPHYSDEEIAASGVSVTTLGPETPG